MSFEVPSWDDVYNGCLELADKIKKSSFKPEVIVGVARGGWIPARILSDLLCNTYVASMRVEFYKDVGRNGKKASNQSGGLSLRHRKESLSCG